MNSLKDKNKEHFSFLGIGEIEFYVTNAFQTSIFYKEVLGFTIIQKLSLEKGVSYLLKQNECFIRLTSSFDRKSSIYEHVQRHGDSVKDITFFVKNINTLLLHFKKKKVHCSKKLKGDLAVYSIQGFGNITHSFIETPVNFTSLMSTEDKGTFQKVDHIAIALEKNMLSNGINFYEETLGFKVSHKEDINVGKGGMTSAVLSSEDDTVKLPLVCPVGEESQIDKYLSYNQGPGVQHVAFLTNNITEAVTRLKDKDLSFLEIPDSYYDNLPPQLKIDLKEEIRTLQRQGILLSGEKDHLLMQVFTKPIQTLPTFFMEIIERQNHTGFGSENIKALFKAVAMDQNKEHV